MRRRRLFRAILALLPVCALLVLAELGLRWFAQSADCQEAAITHRKSEDPTLVYELVPDSEVMLGDLRIKINAAGFRDDEFPRPDTEVGPRIVLLGDSVAWGWGLPMDKAFPQVLESKLREVAVDELPVVYNLAVDGYATRQELRLLASHALAFEPDLVIVNYVLNDPDTQDGGLARCFESSIMILELFRRAMIRLRGLFLGGAFDEYHQRIHAYYAEEIGDHFRQLGCIGRENEIPVLVAVSPVFDFRPGEAYRWQNIHDAIAELCLQNDLLFVDLSRTLREHNSSDYSFDIWHPNAAGHAIMAQVLAEYLQNYPWR